MSPAKDDRGSNGSTQWLSPTQSALNKASDDRSGRSSSVSEEDYDTIDSVKNSPVEELNNAMHADRILMERSGSETSSDSNLPRSYKPVAPSSTEPGRRRSIQVFLEKSERKGRYVLTADETEIREIIRRGIDRELTESRSGKKTRARFRDIVFTRRFTTFDRQNPLSSESPFQGFFTLFWIAMGLLLLKIASQNWRTYGSVLGGAEILHMMVDRDLVVLGLTEGAMTSATVFGVILQKLIVKGYLNWNTSGWIIQSVWQVFYVTAIIGWTFYREWTWTHTIFIVLHAIVFLMKQHSYAFYNGYLSQVMRRKHLLELKLTQLDEMDPISSPSSGQPLPVVSTSVDLGSANDVSQRRRSTASKASTNFKTEDSEISSIATAIESGEPLDKDQMRTFSRIIESEIATLDEELHGKCADGKNCYPNNLTLANWADWTCLPTLVYELEYPRQEKINWWYVAEKTAAVFGVIWAMLVISQAYIYPPVARTVRMKEAGMSLDERWREFPWILGEMLFPLLLEQLLAWYVIWECVLNVLAELTRFADRGFYGDWWNSVSWDYYARNWNIPVHMFLLRHVYHSSISTFKFSKSLATFVTFLFSAIIHELVMFCLFHKLRGYLFAMQLLQLPLVSLSRTKLLKGRNVLGNVIFWFGLFIGPSLITSLYLIV